jgi:hypothetical protein
MDRKANSIKGFRAMAALQSRKVPGFVVKMLYIRVLAIYIF